MFVVNVDLSDGQTTITDIGKAYIKCICLECSNIL